MTLSKTFLAVALIALTPWFPDATAQTPDHPATMTPVPESEHHHRHAKKWHDLSNLPGIQGYGVVLESGWIIPERYRHKSDHAPIASEHTTPTPEWLAASGAAVAPIAGSAVSVAGGDPTGFCGLLNAARCARGLSPVAFNPAAAAASAANNTFQAARGIGHFFLGGFAQCAAVGQPDPSSALSAWSASPGHAAILFDPRLRSVGYHQAGACHTASGSY